MGIYFSAFSNKELALDDVIGSQPGYASSAVSTFLHRLHLLSLHTFWLLLRSLLQL